MTLPSDYDSALIEWIREQLHPLWWFSAAACRHEDPDLFFFGRGQSADDAKRVCARCPVRPACLEFALEEKPTHGVWAGMTYRELQRYGRRRQQTQETPRETIKRERQQRQDLAMSLFDEGRSLKEIAKRLKVNPYEALGYLSQEQRVSALAKA